MWRASSGWGTPFFAAAIFIVGGVLSFGSGQDAARIIVVSKPPPPVVASDPPQGLIFEASYNMSSSSVLFDTSGGPESLEYVAFGNDSAYVTFDDGPNADYPGGILVMPDFLARENGGFDASQDRLISGAKTGLLEPKGIVLAPEQNVIIVADFAAAQVSAFAANVYGDAAPLFVVKDLGMDALDKPRRPWGLGYDTPNDRLFVAATDGNVLVFDNFLESEVRSLSRIITPTLKDFRVSSNLHDLTYLAERDILILSDVGSATTGEQANFDTDGRIMALANASRAEGDTEVSVYLAGANTLLGNPVGLDFDGNNLFVTERTQDLVLRFDNFLSIENADTAPNAAVTVAKPEDIVIAPSD